MPVQQLLVAKRITVNITVWTMLKYLPHLKLTRHDVICGHRCENHNATFSPHHPKAIQIHAVRYRKVDVRVPALRVFVGDLRFRL